MDETLDDLLAAANPVSEDELRRVTESVPALDLCEAIMRTEPSTQAIQATGEPPEPPIDLHAPRRRRRTASRPRWALALAAAALVAVLGVVAVVAPGKDEGRAWAAPLVAMAKRSPLLLIDDAGWRVTRADEGPNETGEMTFTHVDGRTADLHWRDGSFEGWIEDRAASSGPPTHVDVLGTTATVFRYDNGHEHTALWEERDRTLELRAGAASPEAFRHLLASLERVSVDEWLSAMPPSVVRPADRAGEVARLLADVPLPPDFDLQRLEDESQGVSDRYQLGAKVSGAVACGWIEVWIDARAVGDEAGASEAVDALGTAREWQVLHDMDAEGDYPEAVWEHADLVAAGDIAALTGTEEDGTVFYANALGCDQ